MQRHDGIGSEEAAAFAESLADAASPIAMRYFRNDLVVDHKADTSPVTIADREIEAEIRARIRARYPSHGIYGEEHGRDDAGSQHLWVIDPIDGTKSFISGVPTFGTLIAFLDRGVPVAGIVDHPALGERWVGSAGKQTLWNGAACRTRLCVRLIDAILYATSPDIFSAADWARFEAVSSHVGMRRFGGDCYSYALLAGGHIDAVVETGLQPYDYLSLVPVIEGAGGVVTGWRGEPLGLASDGRVVAAATAALHREIIDCLALP
jgi:inositol-phosphate phosphatase / L-galactose 1-phosphate phosphatase / histidinol-phosphatase